jgi:hypothetical protein
MQRVTLALDGRRRSKVLVAPPWATVGDIVRIPIWFVPAPYDPNCSAESVEPRTLVENWEVIEAEMVDGDVVVMQRPGHA